MRNRLTLILSTGPERHLWNRSGVLRVNSLMRLRATMASHDVERIILDRSASADDFLRFLAALPHEIAADVMTVSDDGHAFLSSVGRGGDRRLYALASDDVRFYFETCGLTVAFADLALSA